jgi:ribose transport system substrate-binding protein
LELRVLSTARKLRRPGVCLAAALLLAGCGGASVTAGATGNAEPQTGDLAYAQAQVDKYSAQPTFQAPGEPFDAKAVMAGKSIVSIPVNGAIDFTQFYKTAAERIATKVGFRFTTWQNQGKPTEWGQGIQSGATSGASLIDLFAGIDPQQVLPQIQQARSKNIPLVASDTYDISQPASTDLTSSVKCPCAQANRLMVDWVAAKTGGKGSVLVLTSSDVKASAAGEAAMKEEFAKVAPAMKVTYIDVPSSDWATKIQPQVQSALVGDPAMSYVLPVYDTMSIWTAMAIKQTGRQGKVKVVTYNGTPSILKLMHEDDIIEMDVGQSNDWMAHVILDQEMRIIGGLKPNPDATWPLYIWTKDNLAGAGSPPTDSQGYGEAYKSGFGTLWGLN